MRSRWLGVGVMLVAALQASAAIVSRPLATASTAAATAPRLKAFGVPQTPSPSPKLDSTLQDLAQRYAAIGASHPLRDLHAINPAARFRLSDPLTVPQVLVDVTTTGDVGALKAELEGLGLEHASVYSNDVGGWLPVNQLSSAGALAEVHWVRAAMPRTRSSIVATQGDFVQKSAAARTAYPALTGSGVTVGVLSDSFDCMAEYEAAGSGVPKSGYNGYAPYGFTATYSDDEQAGASGGDSALPGGVNVVEEADCLDYGAPDQTPFTDEGRAILQIVHAVAPGAGLAFYTAVNSEADFAKGIEKLAADGAKIIDDDVGYPDEPFFQDGLIAQAINTVAAQGVVYFSSAGNDGTNSYENTNPAFTAAGSGKQAGEMLLDFDPSLATATTALSLSIPKLDPGEFLFLVVGWDQPYVTGSPDSGGSKSSIDICLTNTGSDLVTTDNNSFGTATACSGASSLGQDPVQILIIGNPADATGPTAAVTASLTIGLAGGTSPGRIKFLLSDDGAGASIQSSFAPGGPTIQGHPSAATAAAVGAAFYFDTPQCGTTPAKLASYSSEGGDPLLFDTSGNRLTAPVARQKPDLVAPDGVNNTILGATLADMTSIPSASQALQTSIAGCEDNSSFPSFFGTSAAAPHAAAAAALMLQASPGLTPTQIITTLRTAALAMTPRATSAAGYDYDDGHGLLQVDAALAALPAGTPSISISPASVTAGGTATLTWNAINDSNCSASGSWSGAQAASGTQTVTAGGTGGTNTYTLACSGASGTVTASTTLTVTANVATQSAATQSSHGGGGALDTLTLTLLLGGLTLRARVGMKHRAARGR